MLGVAHRDCGLDNHHCIWVHLKYQFYYLLNVGSIKEVLFGVIVGGSGNYHKVCVFVGGSSVQSCYQIQRLLCKILLYVIILNGTNLLIDLLYFLRNNINGYHLMVLSQ